MASESAAELSVDIVAGRETVSAALARLESQLERSDATAQRVAAALEAKLAKGQATARNEALSYAQALARLAAQTGDYAAAERGLSAAIAQAGPRTTAVIRAETQLAQIRRQAVEATRQSATTTQSFGGQLLSLAGPLGVATTGIGALIAVGAKVQDGFNLVATLDENRRTVQTLVGDVDKGNKIFDAAAGFARRYGFTQREMGAAAAAAAPLLRTSTVETQKQLEVLGRLASLNAAEGISGATFSVKELASGDITSIVERFNLGRDAARAMKDEIASGADVFEVLDRTLNQMGVTTDVLANRTLGAAGTSGQSTTLTERASEALAQSNALSVAAITAYRFDLPAIVEARYVVLGHRNTVGNYNLGEFYPRPLIQADDMEAESIRAINIGADQVLANHIDVISLAAIVVDTGALNISGVMSIGASGGIYQGSGTFASPTTGLKISNSGGVGKLSTYNGGVEQVTFDTDGRFKAAAGNIIADVNGMRVLVTTAESLSRAYGLYTSDGATAIGALYAARDIGSFGNRMSLVLLGDAANDSQLVVSSRGGASALGQLSLVASNNNGAAVSSLTIFGGGQAVFSDDLAVVGDLEVGGNPMGALSTWTPVLRGSGTAGTFTYTTQVGRYHQFGKLIVAHGRIVISAIGVAPTGTMQITGLPLTVLNASAVGDVTIGLLSQYNFSAGSLGVTAIPSNNTTLITFFELFDNAGSGSAPAAGINATFSIAFTVFYTAA